jgi:CTP:molybdopterin cytidylyltransferase MocA
MGDEVSGAPTGNVEAPAFTAPFVTPADRRLVAGLILAAGGGRRLGGVAKALLPFRGGLLVERAVEAARQGGCDPVIVVLGAEAESVRTRADLEGCLVAVNLDWASGMGSSLVAGLAEVPGDCSAVAVLLVDQPFVSAQAVADVLDAHRAGAAIASATYQGRRSHPVLFAVEHFAEVCATASGDQGAREFLKIHEAEIVAVPCDAHGDPADIDSPDDLALLC